MAELGDLVVQIGQIGLWLQTLGVIVIAWIIFQIINFALNRKRMKEIYHIKEDMKRIESKLDKVLKK